jgi:hypothetical protein
VSTGSPQELSNTELLAQFDVAIARVESGTIVVDELRTLLARARAVLAGRCPTFSQWAVPDPVTGERVDTADPTSRALDALAAIERHTWH